MIEHLISTDPLSVLYNCDCREYMRKMLVVNDRLQHYNNKFDLIFADPPFNQDENYSEWNDKQDHKEFWAFTFQWLGLAAQLLAPTGNLWLNVPDSMAAYVITHLQTKTVGLHLRDWCIWHYRFGQCTSAKFISSKAHALHFIHADHVHDYIWRPMEILVNSDRATKYNDSRGYERSESTNQLSLPIGKRLPLDVWCNDNDGTNWGRIQGNNNERVATQANQLPEKYMERVIRSSSNEDSWTLDLFAGSGTFGAVARALNRKCVMCEIGKKESAAAIKRVEKGAIRVTA